MNGDATSVVCPSVITQEKVVDGQQKCVYTTTAYALLASVLLLVVILALVLVYCCFLRRKSKRRFSEYARSGSHDNNSIGEFPYQPLARNPEGYSNYGTVDSGIDDVRSPSQSQNGSIAERLSQQHDTNSVASSRASLNPNYDEASLHQRTALIANRPCAPTPEIQTQKGLVPKADATQKSSPLSNRQRQPFEVKSNGLYAAVDVVQTGPPTRQKVLRPVASWSPGSDQYAERNVVVEASEPVYAVLEEPDVGGTGPDQSNNDVDDLQVQTDFDYTDQQPPLPPDPLDDNNEDLPLSVATETKRMVDPLGHENNAEDPQYLTILPPQQSPTKEEEELATVPADITQGRRKRLESRADHEDFLLDQLRNMPDSERNGAFLVRESVSTPGCKVLTVFCKKTNSEKEVYNFKIYSTDDGQVYLFRGKTCFQDVDSLLDYFKENQGMLPCVLTRQVYVDQGNTVV